MEQIQGFLPIILLFAVMYLFDDGTCILETGAGKMKFERSALSMELSQKLNAPEKEKK